MNGARFKPHDGRGDQRESKRRARARVFCICLRVCLRESHCVRPGVFKRGKTPRHRFLEREGYELASFSGVDEEEKDACCRDVTRPATHEEARSRITPPRSLLSQNCRRPSVAGKPSAKRFKMRHHLGI
ncbi:hypothetical protein MRX96_030554 [Rhipicephalus microplus]